MKTKSGFALREIVGDKVIMPVGNNISKFNGAVILTETAAFAYELLEQATSKGNELSLDDLTEAVVSEYEVDYETAKKDLEECITKLIEIKVIEE